MGKIRRTVFGGLFFVQLLFSLLYVYHMHRSTSISTKHSLRDYEWTSPPSPSESPERFNPSSVGQPKYAPVSDALKLLFVSDALKLLFIHIPKAGGTAIETSFLFDDRREQLKGGNIGGHNNITAFDQDFFKSYHKFTMVRHPCSRLLSTWRHYFQGLSNSADREWVAEHLGERSLPSFDSFLTDSLYPGATLNVTNQVHLQPQVDMIFDKEGNFALDQLLVFEKWNESLDALSKRIRADLSPLKTIHELYTKQDDCQSVYTLKSWEKMTEIYAMDLCVLGYSSNINEADSSPTLELIPDDLTQRYKECAKKLIHGVSVEVQKEKERRDIDESNSELTSNSCTMYTYYEPNPSASPSDLENNERIVNAWKAAWSGAGWTPRVITEAEARLHPDYLSFREKFSRLPTTNMKEYEVACFMRHVAMATVGGGWMSDYDVIPFHIPPCTQPFNEGMFTVYMPNTPSLVSANSTEFIRVANLMSEIRWQDHPQFFSYHGVFHVSDMFVIRKLIQEKAIRTKTLIVEARQLFNPFSCEYSLDHEPIPNGIPSLPWAVHFSHNSLEALRRSNLTFFWPGSVWNSAKLSENIEEVRPAFMTDAAKYLRETCLRGAEKSPFE